MTDQPATGRPSAWALGEAHKLVRHVGTVWVCDYGADSVARALDAARAEEREACATMRLHCYFCGKSVSTEVPTTTILRALAVCPECIEAGKVDFPPKEDGYGR